MRKILIVHYSINNQERWGRTFPLAKSLAKFGLRVTLLTTANKNQKCLFYRIDKADGVKIVSFKDILPDKLLGKGIGFLSFISRIIHSISHKYDYVYSDCGETPNAGWPCKINQWLFKAKYISEWGDLIGQGGYFDYKPKWFRILFGTYYLWADLYFRHSADIVIVLSTFMKEYAITRGIKNESIVIVPGGAMCDVIPRSRLIRQN